MNGSPPPADVLPKSGYFNNNNRQGTPPISPRQNAECPGAPNRPIRSPVVGNNGVAARNLFG
jgi:hypothetical protein